MTSVTLKYPTQAAWPPECALSGFTQTYWNFLTERKYAHQTKMAYMACVSHFTLWAAQTNLKVSDLSKDEVTKFVSLHIPRCDCPNRVQRTPIAIHASMNHLLIMLRDLGLLTKEASDDPIEEELLLFDKYMRDSRGLAQNTRGQRVRILRLYLSTNSNFSSGTSASISADSLRKFLGKKMQSWSPASAAVLAGSLRGYLRYRAFCGDAIGHLVPIIASPANWRLAPLPETLSVSEITQILGSFSPDLPSTNRAYAMLRCVVDLGLRSSEVVGIDLDDIDWSAGTIRIGMNKSRRVDILPLPHATGKAIVKYLRLERPTTLVRRLFVRHVAPVDKPLGSDAVRRSVREAYRRCGLSHTRVHIIRHTLASRILESGGTLKEVADVLRHRELNTALIYTKVDYNRLSAIGLPWPGVSS